MVKNSELTGPLCKYEDGIFEVMERKGYKFDHVVSTIEPVTTTYVFSKEKQIRDNRFHAFIMTIRVHTWHINNDYFSADYELQLQEYSKNKKGYPNVYWGRTPVAVAKSRYRMSDTNLIKDIHICRPY